MPKSKLSSDTFSTRFQRNGCELHREFDRFIPGDAVFIAARDSFYMATASETGWLYVQHRVGPPGFLRVLDERRLGFADYRGNQRY